MLSKYDINFHVSSRGRPPCRPKLGGHRGPPLLLLFLFCFPLQTLASSYKINNQEIPKQVVLEETGDVLNLRGVAKHKKFFKDYYLAAFYSRENLKNASQALKDLGPKRMTFYYLQRSDTLRSDWDKLIQDNNSPELTQQEQIRINQFLNMVDVLVKEGDIIMLDFIPNIGTKVTVRNSVRGIVKGNEIFFLLLKTWMGRQPPSEKFQKDLFNLS